MAMSTAAPRRSPLAAVPPWVPALVLAIAVVQWLPRGADWPAQLFRVELFRQGGIGAWNGNWYSGHPTPGYSVLFPPLGATFGITVVGVVSLIVAVICFERIAEAAVGHTARVGALVFGIGIVPNLVVGRITFALGLAIGLGAILALQRRSSVLGWIAALATPLASPVAGVFLALALIAWAASCWRRERRRSLKLATGAVLALAPIATVAVLWPTGGEFAFTPPRVALVVAACLIFLGLFAGRTPRPLAIGIGLYLVACTALVVVSNPIGDNAERLAMFFAVPLALVLLGPRQRALVLPLAILGLAWTWVPAAVSLAQVHGDPSPAREFHAPLITQIKNAPGPTGRVEIPFTQNHWEAFYVAAELPMARGWERQADRSLNALFYDGELTARAYRRWLAVNAVRWVALPNVDLDRSARDEAALIVANPGWLREAWQNEDWRLWEVVGATAMVEPPARNVRISSQEVVFDLPNPGVVVVRVRHSRHWGFASGLGCLEPTRAGMMRARIAVAGRIELHQGFLPQAGCG